MTRARLPDRRLNDTAEVEFRRGNTVPGGRLLEASLSEIGFRVPRTRFQLLARLAACAAVLFVSHLVFWRRAHVRRSRTPERKPPSCQEK